MYVHPVFKLWDFQIPLKPEDIVKLTFIIKDCRFAFILTSLPSLVFSKCLIESIKSD